MDNTNTQRPLILVSNDDGYQANGVHVLIDLLLEIGEVVAVCPDGPRSGQSMAITVDRPLRLDPLPDYHGAKMYKVNGTPVDCVKVAMHAVLNGRRPDLVVAGINHGSNASINVVYSGTMGATFEGTAFGIPSIGFSLTTHDPNADMSACGRFITPIVKGVLSNGLPDGVSLNVNIPYTPTPPTEMRVVKGCKGRWSDEYAEYIDPHGRRFFFLTGNFVNEQPDDPDTDQYCLDRGIVSIVAVQLDRSLRPGTHGIEYLEALRPEL